MTGENLVSIIVPVYNVKDYLAECFGSICSQTYRNIEIILVDDGSTDGSGRLCDDLASEDERAQVVHKANGGLSDARNFGVRVARGEWISFVDSDDYISPVFIEVLLRAALDSNCLISAVPFGRQFRDGENAGLIGSYCDAPKAKILPSHDVQRLMLYQALDTGAPWRLYQRKVLDDNPFPHGMYYEDLASLYKIIRRVNYVALIDSNDLYAYRIRSSGIIRQKYSHIKTASALIIVDRLYRDISAWYPDLSIAAVSRCFSLCRMVYAQIPHGCDRYDLACAENDADALWDVLKRSCKVVALDSGARKRERIAASFAILGRPTFSIFCSISRKLGLMR